MKNVCKLLLLFVFVLMLVGCENASDDSKTTPTPEGAISPELSPSPEATTPTATPTPTGPDIDSMTLRERYDGIFRIGVALPNYVIKIPMFMEVVKREFNSFTFENEMKPDHLLNANACQSGYPGTNTEPVLNFSGTTTGMQWAVENDFGVRGHTLVWHSQTPKWFFTTDYKPNSPLASREVMLKRMESYIRQVLTYYQETYPGVIYAWDVVNEAIEPAHGHEGGMRTDDSLWYQTIGEDFVYWAFYYASKYADEGVDLYYNDYNCAQKRTAIIKLLAPILEEGLIDGIGMQCHLSTSNKIANDVYYTAHAFADAGFQVQITELDMQQASESANSDDAQAMKYKVLFERMEGAKKNGKIQIDSVTVWGLYDQISWIEGSPLLFRLGNNGVEKKPAWYGAMQDPRILAIEW